MRGDLLKEAYWAMRHDVRKTVVTILGMAWGIATVVLLLAYGEGFGHAIENIFDSFGAKAVGIFPGRTSLQAGGNKAGAQIRLTDTDIELLRNVAPLIRHIGRISQKEGTVQRGERSFTFPVNGVDPSMLDIWQLRVQQGRWFNSEDNVEHAHVAVISSEANDKLFSGTPALGQTIRANGVTFEVIGILDPRMQEGDSDINRVVYIPYNAMDMLQDIHYLGGIWLDFAGMDHNKLTQTIRYALADAHSFKADDQRAIFVFDTEKQLDQFRVITLALKMLLAMIGTLTLAVGGIGLANIMLVSVTQRTREIGVQKALGARKSHIRFQFLAEALVITAAGGLLGILMSYAISLSLGRLTLYSAMATHAEAGDIRLMVAPKILLISTAILGFVGVLSGWFPALRAANMDPIEALRYE